MPLKEKAEKKSAKRVPSDPPLALFVTKHVFWNCEKEGSTKAVKSSSLVPKHATRTSSDQPKSLIHDTMKGQQVKSEVVKESDADSNSSSQTVLVASKKSPEGVKEAVSKQLQSSEKSKTAIASVANEKSIKSIKSKNSELVKVVPSRFSSTQLMKSRKGSRDSLSNSQPKTTISLYLKPSSPEGCKKEEVLPQYVEDVVKAFLSKQANQYTVKE